MKIILNGCNGKMGRVLERILAEAGDFEIVAGADVAGQPSGTYPVHGVLAEIKESADVLLDFSHHSSLTAVLEFAVARKMPAVIGTTGLTPDHLEQVAKAAESVAILHSANMSFGITMMLALVERAAQLVRFGFDAEITEKHHNQKVDAPSGTALMIANALNGQLGNSLHLVYGRDPEDSRRQKDELGMHSLRGGTIVGEHEVLFAGPSEMIEIRHTALSREVFAQGAVRAARFIVGKQAGLYSLKDVIG
jgi:4-hydroxy-tetrahydrodipicolinate reductase